MIYEALPVILEIQKKERSIMNSKFAGKLKALAITILALGAMFFNIPPNPSTAGSLQALGANKQSGLSSPSQEGTLGQEATKLPKECQGLTPRIIIKGVQNNFVGPPKPTSPSPALLAYLNPYPKVSYDETKVNSFLGDSFELGNCKICYATIEMHLQQTGPTINGYVFGGPYNDTFVVGGAPFTPGVLNVLNGFLYPPGTGGGPLITVTRTYVIPAAALNNYISSGSYAPKTLDVVIQDDEVVDYIKLTLW
jgi:hypothetical protein